MLLVRAEDMLWPAGGERRTPWRDVSRSVTNERWPWLPPRGIDELKSLAIGHGRWRDCEDGYIEKGPFPPPRSAVTVYERGYDDATGEATLEITPRDAGREWPCALRSEQSGFLRQPDSSGYDLENRCNGVVVCRH